MSVQESFDQFDTLLQSFVEDGYVRYDSIKITQQNYYNYNAAIAVGTLDRYQGDFLKAHLINAYNFTAISTVLRFYPFDNTKKIKDFDTKYKITIAKKRYSIKELRSFIKSKFPDPRLAFALNDATTSQTPLLNKAFRPEQLDQMLDAQTRQAMNDTNFVMIDSLRNRLVLSSLFKEFENEIEELGGLLYFINEYREVPVTYGFEIVYRPKNFTLNDYLLSQNRQPINIQNFTPSIALGKKRWEYVGAFEIYSSAREFYLIGQNATSRATSLTFRNNVNYGLTNQLTVGLEFNTKNVLDGGPKTQNPVNVVFTPNSQYFRAIPQYIGPSAKWNPLKRVPRISIQSTFLMPIARDFEGLDSTSNKVGLFMDWDSYVWRNDLLIDLKISSTTSFLTRYSFVTHIPRFSARYNSFLETPISGALAWFPNSSIAVFGLGEFSFSHTQNNFVGGINFNKFSPFSQAILKIGGSAKWQVKPGKTELEISYLDEIAGTNHLRAGGTLRFGLRHFW